MHGTGRCRQFSGECRLLGLKIQLGHSECQMHTGSVGDMQEIQGNSGTQVYV